MGVTSAFCGSSGLGLRVGGRVRGGLDARPEVAWDFAFDRDVVCNFDVELDIRCGFGAGCGFGLTFAADAGTATEAPRFASALTPGRGFAVAFDGCLGRPAINV